MGVRQVVRRQTEQSQGDPEEGDQAQGVLVAVQEGVAEQRPERGGERLIETDRDQARQEDVDRRRQRRQQALAPEGVSDKPHDEERQKGHGHENASDGGRYLQTRSNSWIEV